MFGILYAECTRLCINDIGIYTFTGLFTYIVSIAQGAHVQINYVKISLNQNVCKKCFHLLYITHQTQLTDLNF